MNSEPSILSFRCKHRHTAESHPQCYQRFLQGEKQSNIQISISRHPRSAKILLLDIETLPGEYYSWSPKIDYLPPENQIKGWSISCWAAKWLFDPEIMGEVVTAQEAFDRDDKSILGGIWKLMNDANIVITQNGEYFDLPKLFTKFVENKMKPPARFQSVDTFKTAKKIFAFDYKRLDELGQRFGIGKKLEMSYKDWINCLTNDEKAEKALQHKLEYCKRDVAPLLEDVYLSMLPYIPNHPNLNVFTIHDSDVCPKCEDADLNWSEKPYATPQGLWDSWRCQSCGATGRGTGKVHKIKSTSII